MEQAKHAPGAQHETQLPAQTPLMAAKPPYRSPHVVVYGTVTELTRGSGGDYDDECTSGKKPGDDE